MAYFVHNKYDAESIAALATIDQSANTVIDYYEDYETYKHLDTSAGFGKLYSELTYVTPNTVEYDSQSEKDNSHFNFSSSIIVKSIQRGIIDTAAQNKEVTQSINEINPDKTIVLLDCMSASTTNTQYSGGAVLLGLTKDSFTIKAHFNPSKISYQVVEFC